MNRDAAPATPRALRDFALTVGGALAAVALLLHMRGRATWPLPLALGVALVVAGLLFPARLGPLHRAWMRMALAISRVTTPIFMGIVYFLILTPLGVAMRLLGRRPLGRERSAASFWITRPEGERKSDMKRQF